MYNPKNTKNKIADNLLLGIIAAIVLALVAFFSSCSKGGTSAPPPPPPVIDTIAQYKLNGNLVVITNKDSTSGKIAVFHKYVNGSWFHLTEYTFNADVDDNNFLDFDIVTDSLTTTNYYRDINSGNDKNPGGCANNGIPCYVSSGGDYVNINITSYSNGWVSGNFTAKLTPFQQNVPSQPGSIMITEGQFKNVKCIY